MKNIKKVSASSEKDSESKQIITRKQALKKAGLLTLTTASMLILMKSPAKAATSTPAPPPAW
jgi:hypothetical protein